MFTQKKKRKNQKLIKLQYIFLNLFFCIILIMAENVAQFDQRLAMAKKCSHEGVVAGVKAAAVAAIATAIPTVASVRMLPWAKANLNHTAQALIISTVAGAAYFIVADKTVLATARKNSFCQQGGFTNNTRS